MNYAVDINLFTQESLINEIMMYLTYTIDVANLQNTSPFSSYVDDSINRSKLKNIILEFTLTAVIIILIIPLAYSLRGRAQVH